VTTTVVVDVDLVCLSCGRGRTVSVAALAALPPRDACTVCRGSIVVAGWSNRLARGDDGPFDWNEGKPKVGRPLSRPRPTQEDEHCA
jgi:hypothetical protein